MAVRQVALVAALIPVIAFAASNTTWNASSAAATLIANQANVPLAITTAATTANALNTAKVAGLAVTSLTCVPSGPEASGTLVLTLTDSKAALADSQFPRWIAEGMAFIMGCDKNQVDVWVKAGNRRLTTDGEGRRLLSTVTATYNVYNPNRGRNIGLGIGLGLIAPGLGLGLGLGEGYLRGTTPIATAAPAVPSAAPMLVTTTAAPEEGSSMPVWAGILLALALLACIGAAIMLSTKQEKKKKAPKKKAAPVMAPVQVVEELVPMVTYQQPVQYVQQAAPQYVQRAF